MSCYHWIRPWIKAIASGLFCLVLAVLSQDVFSIAGALTICLGGASNMLVILANDNKMPMGMTPEKFAERSRPDCTCANDATKFRVLMDRFKVGAYYYSLGDFVMMAGLLLMVIVSVFKFLFK